MTVHSIASLHWCMLWTYLRTQKSLQPFDLPQASIDFIQMPVNAVGQCFQVFFMLLMCFAVLLLFPAGRVELRSVHNLCSFFQGHITSPCECLTRHIICFFNIFCKLYIVYYTFIGS